MEEVMMATAPSPTSTKTNTAQQEQITNDTTTIPIENKDKPSNAVQIISLQPWFSTLEIIQKDAYKRLPLGQNYHDDPEGCDRHQELWENPADDMSWQGHDWNDSCISRHVHAYVDP
jgi:hypothetical protein